MWGHDELSGSVNEAPFCAQLHGGPVTAKDVRGLELRWDAESAGGIDVAPQAVLLDAGNSAGEAVSRLEGAGDDNASGSIDEAPLGMLDHAAVLRGAAFRNNHGLGVDCGEPLIEGLHHDEAGRNRLEAGTIDIAPPFLPRVSLVRRLAHGVLRRVFNTGQSLGKVLGGLELGLDRQVARVVDESPFLAFCFRSLIYFHRGKALGEGMRLEVSSGDDQIPGVVDISPSVFVRFCSRHGDGGQLLTELLSLREVGMQHDVAGLVDEVNLRVRGTCGLLCRRIDDFHQGRRKIARGAGRSGGVSCRGQALGEWAAERELRWNQDAARLVDPAVAVFLAPEGEAVWEG